MTGTNRILRQWLLVRSQQPENNYGPFVQEILKSEGLNGFDLFDFDTAPLPDFGPDDIAVLTRCFVTRNEVQQLYKAVENGLRLVCLQPPWNLAARFGWNSAKRVLHPGWVQIGDGYPGAGETLQTHVPLAVYEAHQDLPEYSVVAKAVDATWNDSGYPAVVRQRVGQGDVVFFFYDLPKAIARIRFGDPELASYATNEHWQFLHALDLFCGHVDERVLDIPQAELHSQLLAKVLTDICAYPLARLWYYEKLEHRSAANFSGDDDGSTPEHFRDISDALLERGGRGTFYLMKETHLGDEQLREMQQLGHSFGPHVNAMELPEDTANNELVFAGPSTFNENYPLEFTRYLYEETQLFQQRYGTRSLSLQCHYAPWRGHMMWLPDFKAHGYRLLYNYLSHPKWLSRFMCGAGRPIKFVEESGTVHDCWQQPMLSFDDASLAKRISENVDEVIAEFDAMLRPLVERFHSAVGIASHPISFSNYSKPFLTACWDILVRENVPIYSGDDWCIFIDRRDTTKISSSRNEGSQITVALTNVSGAMTLMLPVPENVTVTVDGQPIEGVRERRLEQEYLFVPIEGKAGGSSIEVVIG